MSSQWLLTKEESRRSPSVQKGMKYEEELVLKMKGTCLIEIVGYRLEMPLYNVATACTLFHRFYSRQSFYQYKYNKIAQACLLVACKSDEIPRRARDIAKSWLYKPNESRNEKSEKAINRFVEEMLYYEVVLLEITCFDVQIDHPYKDLFGFVNEVEVTNDVATAAVAFVNDSLRLPLCLWYEPKAIAAAALMMGHQGRGADVPSDTRTHWGQYIESNHLLIGEIVGSIMEVYKLSKYTKRK